VPISTRKNTEVHADFTPPKKAAALELKGPGADMTATFLSHRHAARATAGARGQCMRHPRNAKAGRKVRPSALSLQMAV